MIAFVVLMLWLSDPWRHSIHVARLWTWARFVAWAGAAAGSRLDDGSRNK